MERPSRHHCSWEKKAHTTPLQKRFRKHGAMVVALFEQPHRDLHAEMSPPPMLKPDEMLAGLDLLNNLDYRNNQLNALDTLAWYYTDDHETMKFGKHLFKQIDLMREGLYED